MPEEEHSGLIYTYYCVIVAVGNYHYMDRDVREDCLVELCKLEPALMALGPDQLCMYMRGGWLCTYRSYSS